MGEVQTGEDAQVVGGAVDTPELAGEDGRADDGTVDAGVLPGERPLNAHRLLIRRIIDEKPYLSPVEALADYIHERRRDSRRRRV